MSADAETETARARPGFSIVELMVVVAALPLALVAASSLLGLAADTSAGVHGRARALRAARAVVERFGDDVRQADEVVVGAGGTVVLHSSAATARWWLRGDGALLRSAGSLWSPEQLETVVRDGVEGFEVRTAGRGGFVELTLELGSGAPAVPEPPLRLVRAWTLRSRR